MNIIQAVKYMMRVLIPQITPIAGEGIEVAKEKEGSVISATFPDWLPHGEVYVFNPYKMIWNGDYYYVVGYSEKYGSIGSFRVDRIVTTPQILSEEQHEPPKDFDLNVYLNSMFRMYNGERKQVELICDNDLMDAIIDKFGKDVDVSAYDENSFKVTVTTSVGNVFYSWIFGFSGRVIIKSPDDVKGEYSKMVAAAVAALEK